MNGILSNLKMKIIAWSLASLAIVMIGFFIEEVAEKDVTKANGGVEVNDHDLDDALNF